MGNGGVVHYQCLGLRTFLFPKYILLEPIQAMDSIASMSTRVCTTVLYLWDTTYKKNRSILEDIYKIGRPIRNGLSTASIPTDSHF